MAFSLEPQVEKVPVTLSLLQLELLITSCRLHDFHLSLHKEVTALFRYELHRMQPAPGSLVCVLRSNDLMDVTRFLGLDVRMTEPGFPNATSRPTERLKEPREDAAEAEYISGPVPLKQAVPSPLVKRQLPRLDNNQLDHSSPSFRDRCRAIGFKSGRPMMECKKALYQADGDGNRAMELLMLPGQFCSTI